MKEILERLEKLIVSKNKDKLDVLLIEVNAHITAYAELTYMLKRNHYTFNKKCEEFCTMRDMITQQMKETNDD